VVASVGQPGVVLSGVPETLDGQLDAVWAVASLVWARADAGEATDATRALAPLALVH